MGTARVRAITKTTSGSLDEARGRVLDLFRQGCRALPSLMYMYNMHEVITLSELRSRIASPFCKHSDVENSKVIDMLVFKGEEELQYCLDHAKQRHHLIGQYVLSGGSIVAINKLGTGHEGESGFLKNFYTSNGS